MKLNFKILLIFVLSCFICLGISVVQVESNHPHAQHDHENHADHDHEAHDKVENIIVKPSNQFKFQPGEQITYSVKKFGIGMGESTLIYEGRRQFEGTEYISLLLKTKIVNFHGEERIYLDLELLLPAIVERNIVFFGKKEKIIERYNQQSGEVVITKTTKKKVKTRTIKKDTHIDNVQAFIFRARKYGLNKDNHSYDIHLPLSEAVLKFEGEEILKIEDADYHTYVLEGTPRNLKVWFDSSDQLVPLRIDGKFGIGNVSLILSNYTNG